MNDGGPTPAWARGQSTPWARIGQRVARRREVLLVSPPVAPPWRDGTAWLARVLAEYGDAYQYRVMGHRGQGPIPGPNRVEAVYRRTDKHAGMRAHLRLTGRLLRPDRCAIHHFIFAPNPIAAKASGAVLRVTGKRSIHTLPFAPADDAKIASMLFAERLVTVSDATALLLHSMGFEATVIRPAVALPPTAPDRDAARRALHAHHRWSGLNWARIEDAPVFLYPGDVAEGSGGRLFLDAAARISPAVPNARFLLAPWDRRPPAQIALNALMRQARALGLGERVAVLPPGDDEGAVLAAIDAVVLPLNRHCGAVDAPMALLKAMALGKPAVISDIPTLAEVHALGPGTDRVPAGDVGACASAMLRLAEEPTVRARMGAGARRTIAQSFSPARMVAAYEALYDDMLDR